MFGDNDFLGVSQAIEWPYIFCISCQKIHECGKQKEMEEQQYQRDQRAYRKKIRRVAHLKARVEWLMRLRARRRHPKTVVDYLKARRDWLTRLRPCPLPKTAW